MDNKYKFRKLGIFLNVVLGAIISLGSPAKSAEEAVPLDRASAPEFLDVRGVGDTGMAVSHQQPLPLTEMLPANYYPEGVEADFGKALDRFDPTGKSYRGDLSFINWETTVGTECSEFWKPKQENVYAFVSHPDNLLAAYRRGFNLIGLANNHIRDCIVGEGMDGALMSARHLERLGLRLKMRWAWHGVGSEKNAHIKTIKVGKRRVRVAFASWYVGGGDCTYVACISDRETVMRSLRDADADLRILSIHSWDEETQKILVETGRQFIREFDGDIVFGHGPHKWEAVQVIESVSGKQGVLFESLGNFIHPYLKPRPEQAIARVLFDLKTLQLRQIQVIPIALDGVHASFNGAIAPTQFPANFTWKVVDSPTWQSGIGEAVRGGYANIQQLKY